MTERDLFADGADLDIAVKRVRGTWYAHVPGTALWGRGADLADAVDALSKRSADYAAFSAESGAPPLNLLEGNPKVGGFWRGAWRIGRVVLLVGLCAMPISYALSTGITRGVEEATKGLRLKTLVADLEQGLIDLSKPENDLSPERAAALREAVERIVERLRPFTAPTGTLFSGSNSGAVQPAAEPRN